MFGLQTKRETEGGTPVRCRTNHAETKIQTSTNIFKRPSGRPDLRQPYGDTRTGGAGLGKNLKNDSAARWGDRAKKKTNWQKNIAGDVDQPEGRVHR